jgi:thioredoxin
VHDVDERSFDDAVAGQPVLVDFWAPWCKPCLAIEPILEELEERIPVLRVNIDEQPGLSFRYGVLAVPTVMLFAGGEPRGTVHGARGKSHYERWLAELLPAASPELSV